MKTKNLIIVTILLLAAISYIIYYAAGILSELSVYKICVMVMTFLSLWILVPLFIRAVFLLIKGGRYKIAHKKSKSNQ